MRRIATKKKRYFLGRMPRGKKDKSRERKQRDHDEEKSAADQSFYALLLWFINMNVVMKIDEYYQRDTQGFVQKLFLDNVNAEFLKEVQRSAEKLVEKKRI